MKCNNPTLGNTESNQRSLIFLIRAVVQRWNSMREILKLVSQVFILLFWFCTSFSPPPSAFSIQITELQAQSVGIPSTTKMSLSFQKFFLHGWDSQGHTLCQGRNSQGSVSDPFLSVSFVWSLLLMFLSVCLQITGFDKTKWCQVVQGWGRYTWYTHSTG